MAPRADTFQQMAVLLLLAAALGALFVRLRQPLIVAFIAIGILVGPDVLGWVDGGREVGLLAQFGITLLLFVVGLRLDVGLIRTLGEVAVATGLGQVVFTSLVGFGLALLLGLAPLEALYLAVALTFSSTIIIVKLLSDKREIDSLHGRIAVGFLIVQDLLVVVAMVVLSTLAPGGGERAASLPLVALRALGLLAAVGVMARFVAPWLLHRLARSPELLLLSAIAWGISLAAVGEALGLSREVGAFLAGVSLASTHYREAIGARLVSLRDFLLLFFFVELGALMDLRHLGEQLWPALVLSLFVLVGNPLIVLVIMGAMGYRKRTSFLAGLTVAQISEFSLVLGALGVSLGHVGAQVLSLITLVGLITIGLSTYMILYSGTLYRWLAPYLGRFERQVPHREQAAGQAQEEPEVDVIVFGIGRYGSRLARALRERGLRVLGVDFDPHAVSAWRAQGLEARYGDAEDFEFPSTLPLRQARWVVSTIPDRRVGLVLTSSLRSHGYQGGLSVTTHLEQDVPLLASAGADMVLHPFADAAEEAARRLAQTLGSPQQPGPQAHSNP